MRYHSWIFLLIPQYFWACLPPILWLVMIYYQLMIILCFVAIYFIVLFTYPAESSA
jgi:hypothetical protein